MSALPPPSGAPGYPPPPPSYSDYGAPGGYAPVKYAGFWIRVATYLLDGLFGNLAMLPVWIPGYLLLHNTVTCITTRDRFGSRTTECSVEHPGRLAAAIVLFGVGYLVWIILNIRWIAQRGQSLAMRITNLRVVRPDTMRPIGTGRSIGRFFAAILSGLCCGLGYLWAAWEPRKRTWHDMMCDTIVVQE